MYSPIKENLNVRIGNNPNKYNKIYKGSRKIKTIKEIEDFYSVEFISK